MHRSIVSIVFVLVVFCVGCGGSDDKDVANKEKELGECRDQLAKWKQDADRQADALKADADKKAKEAEAKEKDLKDREEKLAKDKKEFEASQAEISRKEDEKLARMIFEFQVIKPLDRQIADLEEKRDAAAKRARSKTIEVRIGGRNVLRTFDEKEFLESKIAVEDDPWERKRIEACLDAINKIQWEIERPYREKLLDLKEQKEIAEQAFKVRAMRERVKLPK